MGVWRLFVIRCVVIVVSVAALGTLEGLTGGGPR
jgi:hypothetical protein